MSDSDDEGFDIEIEDTAVTVSETIYAPTSTASARKTGSSLYFTDQTNPFNAVILKIFSKKTEIPEPTNIINKKLIYPMIMDQEDRSTQFINMLNMFSPEFTKNIPTNPKGEIVPPSLELLKAMIDSVYKSKSKTYSEISMFLMNIQLLLQSVEEVRDQDIVDDIERMGI